MSSLLCLASRIPSKSHCDGLCDKTAGAESLILSPGPESGLELGGPIQVG